MMRHRKTFDLTDATNYPTSSLTGTITNAQPGSIDLTSKVTGDVPIANGGTGSNTAPMINIIKADNASAVNTILGLENVTNESKSTMFTSAQLTGTPIAPTANSGTSTTQIATTAFVSSAVNTASEGLHVLSACHLATTSQLSNY